MQQLLAAWLSIMILMMEGEVVTTFRRVLIDVDAMQHPLLDCIPEGDSFAYDIGGPMSLGQSAALT